MTSFTFQHGLGDCIHFCFLAQLYLKRNIPFDVEPARDKRWLFEACGVPIALQDASPGPRANHTWRGPEVAGGVPLWYANKTGYHLFDPRPLPPLAQDVEQMEALWQELLAVRIDVRDKVRNKPSLPPGYILTHTRGHSLAEKKNIYEHEGELFRTLLDEGKTVVHLDWDGLTTFTGERFVNICRFGPVDLEGLVGLIYGAEGMVCVDSGPGHLARLNFDLPTVQVWTKLPPHCFALPRPNLTAVTDTANPTAPSPHEFNRLKVEQLSGRNIAITLLNLIEADK